MSAEKRARELLAAEYDREDTAGARLMAGCLRDGETHGFEVELRAILAAITPQWAEISTAPRDGSMFLAWDGVDMAVVKWDGHQFGLVFTGAYAEDNFFGYVTHWLTLPAPPEGEV